VHFAGLQQIVSGKSTTPQGTNPASAHNRRSNMSFLKIANVRPEKTEQTTGELYGNDAGIQGICRQGKRD
jgi:hypothetical protein